ncbi:MAG: hypothetical protein ABI706_20515 [Ilumatobacteraceae bacterium]
MITLGLLMVLVGFVFMAPRGGIPGSTAHRNVTLGMQRIFTTRGYQGVPSRRYRLIMILIGLALVVGGMVVIAHAGV